MEYSDVIKERFSVRSFKKDPIEKEKLDRILEAGRIAPTAKNSQPQRIMVHFYLTLILRIAPTAKNSQPQRFYVLSTEESFKKLGDSRRMAYEAPIVIMVCADMEKACKIAIEEGYDTSEMDCSIAATQMMLEAWNIGVGSVWVRWFNSDNLHRSFNLPEHIKPILLLPLGYMTDDCRPREGSHDVKNKIEDEVVYL